MTLLLALLTLRCADEAELARQYRHEGTSVRTTVRVCRPFREQTRALTERP